jgi:hypothetical protein
MSTFKPSKELEQLKLSVAALTEKKESNANDIEYMKNAMSGMYNYIYAMEENFYNLSSKLYSHAQDGHLPKLTPGSMKKLLKTCGMDEDYEVAKRVIYANDNKSGMSARIL